MPVAVYLPPECPAFDPGNVDITIVEYESPAYLAEMLGQNGESPVVIVTDEPSDDAQGIIAMAIRDHGIRAIEVRAQRWDGFASSPLSAACQGVISGFGPNGITAAIARLSRSQET